MGRHGQEPKSTKLGPTFRTPPNPRIQPARRSYNLSNFPLSLQLEGGGW